MTKLKRELLKWLIAIVVVVGLVGAAIALTQAYTTAGVNYAVQ